MRRLQQGFTLLEVLVAVVVLGMLIGLLDQGTSFALRVVSMQARASDVAADLPVVEAALRRLIAAADPGIYPEPASMKGTSASLAMVTQVAGPDGALRPVDVTLFAAGGSMRLRVGVHRHVEPSVPSSNSETTVLLTGVNGLAIDYADGATGTWRTTWTAEALPALVRIRLRLTDQRRLWPPIVIAPRLESSGE